MKLIYRFLVISLVLVGGMSCGDLFELDYQDNPNAVTPDKAGPDFVFNSVQGATANFFEGMQFTVDGTIRHTNHVSYTYVEQHTAVSGNGIWYTAYAWLFPDVAALETLQANGGGLEVYVACANIMKAYVMMGLVDFYGDVPYSQALKGTEIISPGVDKGADVYAAAAQLLEQSITTLEATSDPSPSQDLIYKGDKAKWVTFAKTLQMRVGFNTRLTQPGEAAVLIKDVIAGGDFIDDSGEDFVFQYGTERDNPNSRHAFYNNHYENDDGDYMGNYFMWLMCCSKDTLQDPRIRHYFYRQVPDAYVQDPNVYECFWTDVPNNDEKPQHYLDVDPDLPYCVTENGYYGRDHLNGGGIPPDGPIRTVYGLFPGAGKWDNNEYGTVQNLGVDGALGGGIWPVMTSYLVNFMRAEAALAINTGEDARMLLEEAVRGSIAKVRSFEALIPQADLDFLIATQPNELTAAVLLPTDENVDEYVRYVLDRYDEAGSNDDKMDIVMQEYMVATMGNSYEMFNAYRRTGMPANMQPAIDLSPGAFPRSFLYPSDNVNLNANVSQKPNLEQLVFWDDGSATLR